MTLRVVGTPAAPQTSLERLAALGINDIADGLALGVHGALRGACTIEGMRELLREQARYDERRALAFAALRCLNEAAARGEILSVPEARDRIVAMAQP